MREGGGLAVEGPAAGGGGAGGVEGRGGTRKRATRCDPVDTGLSDDERPSSSSSFGPNVLLRSISNEIQSSRIQLILGPKPVDVTNPVPDLL